VEVSEELCEEALRLKASGLCNRIIDAVFRKRRLFAGVTRPSLPRLVGNSNQRFSVPRSADQYFWGLQRGKPVKTLEIW
jgi:hypothetical protein